MVSTYCGILLSLKKEILSYTKTWVILEGIKLNEISQSYKEILRFHFVKYLKVVRFIKTK